MLTNEALELFGGKVRPLAEALGLSVQAVYAWGDTVPPLRAYQIRDIINQRQQIQAQEKQAA